MNHTVFIDKIVHGGLGLGRLENNFVVLTPFVLPGEKVTVRETQKKRGYILAEPENILEASPDRIAPPCPYYTICGGCNLQHMNIGIQHTVKEQIVRETLARAKVLFDDNAMQPIVPSPEPLQYRYRIRLKISPDAATGFYQAGSNTIVAIDRCLVATEELNNAMAELRISGLFKKIAPHVRELELLQSPADKRIFCILHTGFKSPLSQNTLVEHASSLSTIESMIISNGGKEETVYQKSEETMLRQDFDASACGSPFTLAWTPSCFSQVNARQNENLIHIACKLAAAEKGERVLDLFCGMGNFSIPLALQGATVTGIEMNPASTHMARENARAQGLANTHFLDRDVHRWLTRQAKHEQYYNLVIVDPPRQGLGKSITLLTGLAPSRIIYISCDPATFARDIALARDNGYGLRSITPVDMFPQTHHIETVALLEKN